MNKIVLIGAGGHCKVIIDIIESLAEYEIIGITDKEIKESILNVPVIGDDDVLQQLYNEGVHYAFICVGALNKLACRNKIYNKLKKIGFSIPVLVHKNAIKSPFSRIQEGTCVMPGAIINSGAVIGKNCIINTGSVIEHDCIIGDNTHISPNVAIAGGVKIGRDTHIGIGSSVIENLIVGCNVTVGAGAVVLDNIKNNAVAVGMPAKIIRIKTE